MSQEAPEPEKRSVMLLVCSRGEAPEALRKVLQAFEKSDWIRVRFSDHWEKSTKALSAGGVFVGVIRGKEDLIEFTKCITLRSDDIRDGRLKAIAMTKIDNPRMADVLLKRGTSDVLTFEPPVKALFHKLEKFLQMVDRRLARTAKRSNKNASGESGSHMRTEGSKGIAVTKKPPLEVREDYWAIDFRREIKSVMGRWLIEAVGPAPSAGSWEAMTPPPEAVKLREQAWKWVPRPKLKDAENPFRIANGYWAYFGAEPSPSWEKHLWIFVGR